MLVHRWYQSPAAYCPAVIIAGMPINTTLPVVSGTAQEDEELACTEGIWDGDTPMTFAYQWYQFVADAPASTGAPVASGAPTVGSILHCTDGIWSGDEPIAYAYQWKQSPATDIGTGLPDYTIMPGDEGFAIFCTVTATNLAGSASADSNERGPITVGGVGGEVLTDEGEEPLLATGEELTV